MGVDLSGQVIPAVKHSDAPFDVLPPIRNRWSPRVFLDKPVSAQDLQILLQAARWAASCFNEQPWRFIVATREQPEDFARLLSTLAEKNQHWAGKAPVLLLSVACKNFAHNGKFNRHYLHDTGAAAAALCIQAASMGLATHQMAGFDGDKARTLFGIPADFEPCAAMAIGYAGPATAAAEEFQKAETAPRTRRPLNETAFTTKWGNPL